MPAPSPGYSITLRVEAPTTPGATADLSAAVGKAGGVLTALDVVESHYDRIVVDVTCNATDADHADAITEAVSALPRLKVRKVSDRTFLMHLGGKLEVTSKVPLRHRDDLSRAYTPGVARVCQAIAANPDDARRLTIKRNTVAVVTDGSAVLGLGNLGPAAALPVMEGKAALFKRFADVDAWPVCLDTQDTDEIVEIVRAIAPVYGGINLEDIAAPRCFEIEARLREMLDIPVFHDDQHGTAIVVLAALTNALRVVGDVAAAGAGSWSPGPVRPGRRSSGCCSARAPADVVAFDSRGAVHGGREGLDPFKTWIAEHTNQAGFTGTLHGGHRRRRRVHRGVGAEPAHRCRRREDGPDGAIVLALANPDPEVDPIEAQQHAAVVATGRSDFPNQINNVLAFPGIFRGLLDAGARDITDAMLVAAATAIADVVHPDELNASYIVPSVFDPTVAPAVAAAVRAAVTSS